MFFSKIRKNNVYPCKPQFYYIKVGFKGVYIIQVCFRDVMPLGYCQSFISALYLSLKEITLHGKPVLRMCFMQGGYFISTTNRHFLLFSITVMKYYTAV